MKDFHLSLFGRNGQECAFVGDQCDGELANGILVAKGVEIAEIRDGIAIFDAAHPRAAAGDGERAGKESWIAEIRSDGCIGHNWQNQYDHSQYPLPAHLCSELAAVEGPILEIAAGPGGGNLSPVLHSNPRAEIIVNDIVAPILEMWREFLDEQSAGPNVSFAAFDATHCPIRDGSLSAVSSSLGFGSVCSDDGCGDIASVREAARLLASGGRVFASEWVIDPRDWSRLQPEVRSALEDRCPGMARDWGAMMDKAGLHVRWHQAEPGRALIRGEGGWADAAQEFGLELHVQYEYLIAVKP